MGKTGGGMGTNQYGVRGVSQSRWQGMGVIDGLAENEPAHEEELPRPRIIDPPRFSQFREHDCRICGHESLRHPMWIDRGGGPEAVGPGCLATLLGAPANRLAAERDRRLSSSMARWEVVEERLTRYRMALIEYQMWEEERQRNPHTEHIVQRDPTVSDFNRLRHEWARSDPDLLPPAAFAQWLTKQIAKLDAELGDAKS